MDKFYNTHIYKYIKSKKTQRQIILVTHNANVVVNADAEEVIVANQHGKDSKNKDKIKFQYISGSLENTKLKNIIQQSVVLDSQGIKEHTCEILEGGTDKNMLVNSRTGFLKQLSNLVDI
jgi:acetoin utilization deacetylase AcuC-like enzyme